MELKVGSAIGAGRMWTHPSVLALAGESDPFEVVVGRARDVVLRALESGWSGPPYDPFVLAEFLRINVQATQDVVDARTVTAGASGFRIEFNPNRPRPRVNYSVAHEIAHTLFPDCAHVIRHRYTHADMKADDWQLEMLCNIAASEFLMPVGSFALEEQNGVSIDKILEWRNKYSVSTEAVLLRYAKLTANPSLIFTAHRDEGQTLPRYCIDYAVPSRTFSTSVRTGFLLPDASVVKECTGIGFTAKSDETWITVEGRLHLECVGVPPYPGSTYPRVLGLLAPRNRRALPVASMSHVVGDATLPRGSGRKIIVQLVNDKALTWGRGFALAVRRKWPKAQQSFTEWASSRSNLRLGNIHGRSFRVTQSWLVSSLSTATARLRVSDFGTQPWISA